MPGLFRNGSVDPNPIGLPRTYIVRSEDPADMAEIRLDWDGEAKKRLVTAFRGEKGDFSARNEAYRTGFTDAWAPASNEQEKNTFSNAADQGSIPAGAGEPQGLGGDGVDRGVDPRGCGGAM